MGEVLVAILVIAGLATVLAVLIIVADAVLLDYGECVITINEEEERDRHRRGALRGSAAGGRRLSRTRSGPASAAQRPRRMPGGRRRRGAGAGCPFRLGRYQCRAMESELVERFERMVEG